MREVLLEKMKVKIESNLKAYLSEEGIELFVATNDNQSKKHPLVVIEAIDDRPLKGHKLLSEIRVILGILGKPWQCDALGAGYLPHASPSPIDFQRTDRFTDEYPY